MNGGNSLPAEKGKEVDVDRIVKKETAATVEEQRMVDDAIAKLQDYMQNEQRGLNFKMDEEAGITVISVYDAETEELIRQIPSEEMVSLAKRLNEQEPSVLFSARV
ncbi:putative flagellar protein FlaG [Gynuella sunshinyii YC6258]|uniref:Putative flagellar protein FlaG n=1 Tax=Gynuella sunshinyii YC6258 TaxID=1445510 RepID=A0A0C5W102_9GAMM|nr:putative flagellar protein FlaG [Gynuella sunshinyii YC6258]